MELLDALTRTNTKRAQELPTTYQAHHLPPSIERLKFVDLIKTPSHPRHIAHR